MLSAQSRILVVKTLRTSNIKTIDSLGKCLLVRGLADGKPAAKPDAKPVPKPEGKGAAKPEGAKNEPAKSDQPKSATKIEGGPAGSPQSQKSTLESIDAPKKKFGIVVENVDQTKLEKLAKEVMALNLSETVAFVNLMQDLLGLGDVRAMLSAGAAAPAASNSKAAEAPKKEAPAAPAKSVFELKLDGFEAADKIKVIKVVREITGLGLKEAKDAVEGAPKVLLKEVTKEQGTQLLEKLKANGAKASLV